MPADSNADRAAAELLTAYRRLVADVHELAHVSRRISDREARQAGATASQWHVLSAISDGGRTVPSIARRLGLSRQAVQRTCDELVSGGNAVAVPNPQHLRSPLIEATQSGLALQRRLYEATASARLTAIRRAELASDDLIAAAHVIRGLLESMSPRGERAELEPHPSR